MPQILAIDPGETTGACVYAYGCRIQEPELYHWEYEFPLWRDINKIIEHMMVDAIVVERFSLYPGRARALSHNALIPVQVIGVIKYIAEQKRILLFEQTQGAKDMIKIDKRGLSNHMYDALRHAIAFSLSDTGKNLAEEEKARWGGADDIFMGGGDDDLLY